VDYYVDGKLRCYFLKDPMTVDILKALRKEYNEELPRPACCPVRPNSKRAAI
jgi:ArsR family transcriptional regulator